MVIRPYGYAIWESIQAYLDRNQALRTVTFVTPAAGAPW
jgi:hypothetical protein